MRTHKIVMILALLSLSACVTTSGESPYAPTPEELAKADYGAKPTNYKSTIKEYVQDMLIDPESARFSKFSEPKKDWLSEWSGFGAKKHFGWLVCVEVNAKNRYGGYTGSKPYFFIIRGDNVTFAQTNGDTHKNVSYGVWKYPIEC